MSYETTYLFFNLLLCGLLTGEIYRKVGRSQRRGLALGLVVVGLFIALTFAESKAELKREWLRIGAVIFLIISLTCLGEVAWGETRFKVILMTILLMAGLLSAWAGGEWLNLPATFWLWVSAGTVIATFAFGLGYVDFGAYFGAWLWLAYKAVVSHRTI